MADNAADTEVFVYMGEGGDVAPRDVICLRVDPTVPSIPARAFSQCTKLTEVELCEGLVEIGGYAFAYCGNSISNITKINIPTSLRRICDHAFWSSLRCPICLHDGIESIGRGAFANCIFTNFRVPPLITVIPDQMLYDCKFTFSVEMSKNVTEIGNYVFDYCHCLRNVAFPPEAVISDYILGGATDLLQLFDSVAEITRNLKNRFDELPVHSTVYYQSYNQGVLQRLITELDPTGNEQDCLGMTPLHILACSSVHNLEVYRLIVEKYPANLITEDRWGAVPLLYAFWGDAPIEIINFLIDSYQYLYPDHEFDWTDMVITLGRANAPAAVIQNLLDVQHILSPDYNIDWDQILEELATATTTMTEPHASHATFCFLTRCSIATRVSAIGVKHFQDDMADNWMGDEDNDFNREMWRNETLTKLEYYESEYHKLKESTSLLKLALWKMNIDASNIDNGVAMGDNNRLECRTNCGADFVIENVLPYLLPSDFVRSYVNIRNEEDSDSSNNDDDDDDDDNDDGWEE
jgi:hypothetical protein